jgi:cytochrome P450
MIFRHRIRHNDGEAHRPFKQATTAAFDALTADRVARASERWAERLAREIEPAAEPDRLAEFAFALPLYVLGSLLGVADDTVPAVVQLVEDFVSPESTPEQAKDAAGQLWERFQAQLRDAPADSLLTDLAVRARHFGCDDLDVVLANAIGLLIQAREATAGLICASLLTLARRPDVRETVARTPALLGSVVEEVIRYDPPVQNTRRFVAERAKIEGQELRPGEAVLVVLAAANRDPGANHDPDHFDVTRRERRIFTFGVGPHTCPGQRLAVAIATAAVARLLDNGIDPDRLDKNPAYRPSANVRIPLLGWTKGVNNVRSDL